MAVFPLTLHLLRHEVARVQRKAPDATVIGFGFDETWDGGDEVVLDGGRFALVRAETVLEVREALTEAEGLHRPTILLTKLEPTQLGQDIVARLARGKLGLIDPWEGVKGLFKARQLDPSLREGCLALALLNHAPPEGYNPVPAAVLDSGTAWRAIFRHTLGMEDREPDLAGLLRWGSSPASDHYLSAATDLRRAVRARLETTLGGAAGSILDTLDSGDRCDPLAVAIACEIVFHEAHDSETILQAAAVRLERFHANRPVKPDIGRVLAKAGAEALDDLDRGATGSAVSHLVRADALLDELGATAMAHLGSRTPLSWEARLGSFAKALIGAIEAQTAEAMTACQDQLRLVAEHSLAKQPAESGRLERAKMAARLVRWLGTPNDFVGSFAQLTRRYADEVSFVDWARATLAGGDESPGLSDAYGSVERAVALRRSGFDGAFVEGLADWTRSGSDASTVLRVEDVAIRAIKPVMASKIPVLWIVLDGMSWPVAHELLADLRRHHWGEALSPGTAEPPPPVIAAVPSVTEVSRTSLLVGYLHRGHQGVEQSLFAANPGLGQIERNYPPRLFHKKDLTQGSRGSLAEPVRQAIAEKRNRIVAVVINAVDDRLAGASQVRDAWSIETIRPLGALLREARESGRAVVLASDHGHVWHHDAPLTPAEDASSRWRPADGPARVGEVLLEGNRVRGPGDTRRLIAAWSEEVRYGMARNGYHGGASPQEMVAPLIILADGMARDPVLEPGELRSPFWWEEFTATPAKTAARPRLPRPTTKPEPSPGPLFPTTPTEEEFVGPLASEPGNAMTPPTPGWLASLIGSATYQDQRRRARKVAVEDTTVFDAVATLAARGGAMTPEALARAVGQHPSRIDGFVVLLQRILNVDGYNIIHLDRERDVVELDEPLLRRQFGLE